MQNIKFSDLDCTQMQPQKLSDVNLAVQTQIQGGNWFQYLPTLPIEPSPTFPPIYDYLDNINLW